jgi:EmrB/QacA subfamily drug resistance transporter
MLGIGRLGDMIGKKRIYILGIGFFTVGSLLCGLAPGVGWLIAFRVFQGLGAVMVQALGAAMITEVFPANERGKALGIMGSIVSLGLSFGPAIGGIIIGLAGWRWIFLVNVPIGIICLLVSVLRLPSSLPVKAGQRFDYFGAAIMFLILCSYCLAMTLGQKRSFEDMFLLLMVATTFIGLVAFFILEKKLEQPMVDLELFNNVLFSISLIMGFLVFVVLGGFFIIPFFLQLVLGYTTQKVGLVMMVLPILMGAASPVAGTLSDRHGPRVITIIGLLFVTAGCFSLSTLNRDISWLGYILRAAPLGLGMGLFQSPNNSAIMGSVTRHRFGIASGLISLSRSLGQVTGMPLMGAIFLYQVYLATGTKGSYEIASVPKTAIVHGIQGTYKIAAIVVLVVTVIAAVTLYVDPRRTTRNS